MLIVENSATVRMMLNVTQSLGNVYVYRAGMAPSVNKCALKVASVRTVWNNAYVIMALTVIPEMENARVKQDL